jgi:hypothetical protein
MLLGEYRKQIEPRKRGMISKTKNKEKKKTDDGINVPGRS